MSKMSFAIFFFLLKAEEIRRGKGIKGTHTETEAKTDGQRQSETERAIPGGIQHSALATSVL